MTRNYLLGYDVGSSSVKASLVDVESGACVASAFYPKTEAPIKAVRAGWAEQDPNAWWEYLKSATADVLTQSNAVKDEVKAIGISYQMHGLVCVDKDLKPLRDAIIWCDSRAVPYGQKAFDTLGSEQCLSRLLNSPGNFTAAKLAWVHENEPETFNKIYKVMLPGDYIACRLSGTPSTTVSGLSEGMMWDFKENRPAQFLLDFYGIPVSMLSDIVPTFGIQGEVNAAAAAELGLAEGTPITYRAGDQPNNALSLDVFEPGEAATTAGTSGVVYGVLGNVAYDPLSRVNTFAHVNHNPLPTSPRRETTRLGVLLCINGTGILNSWMRRIVASPLGGNVEGSYAEMNDLAARAPIGAAGLSILPFGNGAERVLCNKEVGASIHGINFNTHTQAHLLRAAQEGIVFSFAYGMKVMQEMGMSLKTIRAGKANMFLSPIFRNTLAGVTGATIELCDTDGSVGAARGAGIGAGIYANHKEAFAALKKLEVIEPIAKDQAAYREAYEHWLTFLP
ncbi:MAG: carbohydrate kinase [Bacteroidaceae bacterium]|nr:carbohydrate kinase [Bacteroidaceae bacterium]